MDRICMIFIGIGIWLLSMYVYCYNARLCTLLGIVILCSEAGWLAHGILYSKELLLVWVLVYSRVGHWSGNLGLRTCSLPKSTSACWFRCWICRGSIHHVCLPWPPATRSDSMRLFHCTANAIRYTWKTWPFMHYCTSETNFDYKVDISQQHDIQFVFCPQ